LISVDLQAGRYQDVIAQGLALQKRWPKGAIGYLAQTEALVAQKDFVGAEKVLRSALNRAQNAMLAMRLYGLLLSQGRTAEADRVAASWVEHNPTDFLVAESVGEASMNSKDFVSAARWYKSALKAQPNNAMTLNNLAWVLGQQRDPSSWDYGRKALSIAPENPAILDTVGWLYIEAGDLNHGLELLSKANELAPNAAPIKLNFAKALVKAGQDTVARPHLEALTKLPAENAVRQEAEKILSAL
jgi:tetratricopeptide (TPR) repeat protein